MSTHVRSSIYKIKSYLNCGYFLICFIVVVYVLHVDLSRCYNNNNTWRDFYSDFFTINVLVTVMMTQSEHDYKQRNVILITETYGSLKTHCEQSERT